MKKTGLIPSIVNEIVTTNDKIVLLELISLVRESLYTKDVTKILNKIKAQTPERFYTKIEYALEGNQVDKDLSTIEMLLLKTPVAQITIAYEPTRKQIEEIAQTIQNKLGQSVIIDYSLNQNIGIGIQIDILGKRYKKTIEDILKS